MSHEHVALPVCKYYRYMFIQELFLQGYSNLQPFLAPKASDVATICYTSGTTGTPKV